QVAAHVRANTNIRLRRRHELKVRIKAGDTVDLIEGSVRALGKGFEFRLGQEAVAKLNSSQVVEDHGAASRIEKRRSSRVTRRGVWYGFPCILLAPFRPVNRSPVAFSRHAAKKTTRLARLPNDNWANELSVIANANRP